MCNNFTRKIFGKKNNIQNKSNFKDLDDELKSIEILPMDDITEITKEIRDIIYSVFMRYNLLNKFKGYKKYFIYVSRQVSPAKTVTEAHKIWLDLSIIETFDDLPKQNINSLCIPNLLLVRVECIENYSISYRDGGWGFKGYVFSLLIDMINIKIWDARGEPA